MLPPGARRTSHAVSVRATLDDGRTVAALAGALDVATAPQVADDLKPLARRGPLVLDLSALAFVDAAGLRALRDVAAIAAERDHRVSVLPPVSPAVEHLMGALRIDIEALLCA